MSKLMSDANQALFDRIWQEEAQALAGRRSFWRALDRALDAAREEGPRPTNHMTATEVMERQRAWRGRPMVTTPEEFHRVVLGEPYRFDLSTSTRREGTDYVITMTATPRTRPIAPEED